MAFWMPRLLPVCIGIYPLRLKRRSVAPTLLFMDLDQSLQLDRSSCSLGPAFHRSRDAVLHEIHPLQSKLCRLSSRRWVCGSS